jgi:phosphocarrier protein
MIMTLGAKQGTEVVVSSEDETVLRRIAGMVAANLDSD